jgi:hypothetical protein
MLAESQPDPLTQPETAHLIRGDLPASSRESETPGGQTAPALLPAVHRLAEIREALVVARRRRLAFLLVGLLVALLGVGCLACIILAVRAYAVGSPELGKTLLLAAVQPTAIVFSLLLVSWSVLRFLYRNELDNARQHSAFYQELLPALPHRSEPEAGVDRDEPEPRPQKQLLPGPLLSALATTAPGHERARPGLPADEKSIPSRRKAGLPPPAKLRISAPKQELLAALDQLANSRQALVRLKTQRRLINGVMIFFAVGAGLGFLLFAVLTLIALAGGFGSRLRSDLTIFMGVHMGLMALAFLIVMVQIPVHLRRQAAALAAAQQESDSLLRRIVKEFPEVQA